MTKNKSVFMRNLAHLVFPQKCLSCEQELTHSERSICSICTLNYTETNFHLSAEPTIMDQLFWGRINIHHTYSLFFFEKDKTAQKILFQLKYRNNQTVGHYFGCEIGKRILQHQTMKDLDAILPVPLHPKKQFIRGYNQSEAIAKGISDETHIPMDTRVVSRVKHGISQTKKSKADRWKSIQSTFVVHPEIKKYNHIAIVDDVITTGSTIESIAQGVYAIHPNVKISVITLAIT